MEQTIVSMECSFIFPLSVFFIHLVEILLHIFIFAHRRNSCVRLNICACLVSISNRCLKFIVNIYFSLVDLTITDVSFVHSNCEFRFLKGVFLPIFFFGSRLYSCAFGSFTLGF